MIDDPAKRHIGDVSGVVENRLKFERELVSVLPCRIAGVDEAGRGPLAGPVVAAAVVLPLAWVRDGLPAELTGLNDSKQLSVEQRNSYFLLLTESVDVEWALGESSNAVIDSINILQATHRAMNQALRGLKQVSHALVDGRPVKGLMCSQTAIVKGDSKSYSIAAASVLAKVTRDHIMLEAEQRWPGYGFAQHKGYGTPEHLEAIRRLGPCPIHRRSFAPMREPEPELFPR